MGAAGWVIHLSGDEFVVILQNVVQPVLADMGQRICDAVERLADEDGWPIRASIGSVLIHGDQRVGAADVLKLADEMMYSAKRSGGGQQMMASLGGGSTASL